MKTFREPCLIATMPVAGSPRIPGASSSSAVRVILSGETHGFEELLDEGYYFMPLFTVRYA